MWKLIWEYIIENWIAITALVISLITLFRDVIKDFIEYIKEKNEAKKAKITISFINDKLIISNKGIANAKNLRIYVDDDEIQKNSVFSAFARDMDFSMLSSNNSYTIKCIKTLNSKKSYKIKVIWEDEKSKNNIVEDIINI